MHDAAIWGQAQGATSLSPLGWVDHLKLKIKSGDQAFKEARAAATAGAPLVAEPSNTPPSAPSPPSVAASMFSGGNLFLWGGLGLMFYAFFR